MDGWRVLEQASELARRGEAFALATVVWRQGPSSGQLGSRAIITAAGELHGWIGGACAEPVVVREARQVIADGTPRLLLLGPQDRFGGTAGGSGGSSPLGGTVPEGMTVVPIACQSEGALEVYIEPVLPTPHLVVVGRSPMAQVLAELGRALGWRAELRDVSEFNSAGVNEGSMVVVATQGHGDEGAIEQAVAARPAYLGLVGSRRRGAVVLGYLADRGVRKDQLDRVRIPAGLDLGHTSHTEIAVSILAELVQLRASGALGTAGTAGREPVVASTVGPEGHSASPWALSIGDTTGPEGPGPRGHGTPRAVGTGSASAELAQAVDPVCGMTVTVGEASRPLTHDGVTYHFCCARCHAEFESDPKVYSKLCAPLASSQVNELSDNPGPGFE